MLEDLCLNSLHGSQEMSCIDAFFECIGSSELKHVSKSKIQAYLSTKPEAVNSLGIAAAKGYWDFRHECFTSFIRFLRNFS